MHEDGKGRGAPLIKSLSLLAVTVFIVALLWGSDRITMQGERTIYTADCERGTWNGDTCSGARRRTGTRSGQVQRSARSRQALRLSREPVAQRGRLLGPRLQGSVGQVS